MAASANGQWVLLGVARTTASTGDNVVANKNMPYVANSDGKYQVVIQSTGHNMAQGSNGFVDIVVDHLGLDDQRRVRFRVEYRGTT